jgi:NAD(P)H-hydrate epimerase
MKTRDAVPSLPERARDAHKGNLGRVLVLGGSRGMIGAAVLAGTSALRSGAGLCTVATPASCYPILAAKLTCCTTHPLPETPDATLAYAGRGAILELAEAFDAVALGPGLGRHRETTRLVASLVRHVGRPMVIDADALNALAEDTSPLQRAKGPRVVTPHPGEMARLLGESTPGRVQERRAAVAGGFAAAYDCVVALKGHRTLVTDGERLYTNRTGNPGMATGGTGDVLTGVIAALLARGLAPFEAAVLGVHLHGLAGDIAARERGQDGMIASDVMDRLPEAARRMRSDEEH